MSGDVTWMEIPTLPLLASQLARWRELGVPIGRVGNRIGDTRLQLKVESGESVDLQPHSALSISSQQSTREGELWVAGSALALGYVTRTAAGSVFGVLSPAGPDVDLNDKWVVQETTSGGRNDPHRWFRTGDICKIVDDEIFYCGRRDSLVKIRGQRVQLEAVERAVHAALAALDTTSDSVGVLHVAVLAAEERGASSLSSKSLVAFLVCATTDKRQSEHRTLPSAALTAFPQKARLLQWIKDRYGDVYVPRDVVVAPTDCVKRLSSGKLDKVALAVLYASGGTGVAAETALGHETTQSLRAACASRPSLQAANVVVKVLVAKLLGYISRDVMECTFQELGGNSLHAALFCWELQQELGCNVSVQELVRSPLFAGGAFGAHTLAHTRSLLLLIWS